MARILGIGDNTVDIYVDRGARFPGGNAVNVAVLARRLGADTGYLGCLGRDLHGELLLTALKAEKVDISHLRLIDGPNPWCRIRHDGADRRFERSIPGVRGRYDLTPADDAYIASFDLAHTSISSDLDGEMERLAAHAPILSYDFSEYWRRRDMRHVYPHCDIAFLSAPDMADSECEALATRTLEAGVKRLVAITRGARGSCALVDGRFYKQDIEPAVVVDTLGAGDAFIAAFLVSYLGARDVSAALKAGARNAAIACSYEGAFGHGSPASDGQPGMEAA